MEGIFIQAISFNHFFLDQIIDFFDDCILKLFIMNQSWIQNIH